MEDGTKAVGLFNRGETANVVKVNWSELGLSGPKVVRDLWRQKDEGSFEAGYSVTVPRHGAKLIRLLPTK